MIKIVIIKELRDNIYSYKFLVCLLLIPFLISISTLFFVQKQKINSSDYHLAVKEIRDQRSKIDIFSALVIKEIMEPKQLSPFSEGLERNFGDIYKISVADIPTLENSVKMTYENPFLVDFYGFDLTSIFVLIMSIMAIFWGHNTISGEKEEGTLGLILSNPIPRNILILGKCISGMITLLIPVLAGFLTSLLIILFSGVAAFGLEQWTMILILFLAYLLFLLLCYLVAVFFSILSKKSSIALLGSMFFWIIFIILIPNLVPYIVDGIKPIPSKKFLRNQVSAYNDEFKGKISEFEKSSGHKNFIINIRANFIPGNNLYSLTSNGIRVETTHKPTLEYMKRFFKYIEPIRLSFIDKIERLYQDRMIKLKANRKLYEKIASISPAFLLTNTAEIFCGTDLKSYESFVESLNIHRRQIINILKKKKIFESFQYFTSQFSNKNETPGIFSDLTPFKYKGLSISQQINEGMDNLFILFIEILFIFLINIILFLRYDPR
jgi:ABC-type transport system involved in multi-copper enzyme maturation permease subunit